jgi:hypothetical protein
VRILGAVCGLLAPAAAAFGIGELVRAGGDHGDAPGIAIVFVGLFFLALALALALVAVRTLGRRA